jgi:FdhD protein
MHDPVRTVDRKVWRGDGASGGARAIPEETAIALTYNGGTYAVMMGTPQNLRDFAVGFSLSEGVVQSADEIEQLDVVELDDGIELRMWLAQAKAERLGVRRRHIAGPTGCGLCGIESIAEAVRPAAIVRHRHTFSPQQVMTAMQAIASLQKINIETRHRLRASLPCARMSAAITRSISWPARWRWKTWPQTTAWCCSPAGSRWKWCRRPRPSALR